MSLTYSRYRYDGHIFFFAFIFFVSFFRFLQTVDSAKGRGLGKLVMKIYLKYFVARENVDLFVFIRVENFISRKLFQGLGFEDFKTCSWSKLKPLN